MDVDKDRWTIGRVLSWTKQYFADKGVEQARLDAEVLLSHVLGMDRLHLYVRFDQPLLPEELAAFRAMVLRRAAREPVAYILGCKEFMGLEFFVSSDVLVPRPDTELLIEACEKRLQDVSKARILEIGPGSGAVVISLLKRQPQWQAAAVELSPRAAQMVRKNAKRHEIEARLQLYEGDLFAPVAGEYFDAIISNPPYIPEADLDGLQPEVHCEPRMALAGGEDGLDFYRRLVREGGAYVCAGGWLLLEVGSGQAKEVAQLGAQSGWQVEAILPDYAGIERVVALRKQGS
nr:peptide chain release factor N(5)-glutamine methyltransferase [uncultured Anaeromusa sp.]